MAGFRQDRLNEQIQSEVVNILRAVKDPRVSGAFVSIISVNITKDLSLAKIYFSVIDADVAEVKKGLDSAVGFIRSSLAKNLNLRITPKLVFVNDDSAEKAIRISEILKEIK
ncbi:MAG: 30S ribosome-binding factor RbfA [Clostridia bacterium]